ncbi:MAG: class I SAM-dependent methyltransferase [Massiliimalia sp.]|jgi:SAM-dependent methyltransferase
MDQLLEYLSKIVSGNPKKIVISNPAKQDLPFQKIEIQQKTNGYLVEKRTQKQVFHETVSKEQLQDCCNTWMKQGFRQLNAWTDEEEYSIKISKKGKVLFGKHKLAGAVKTNLSHNRKKQYLLGEGTVIPPLVDMGVFTKEGKIVQSMYDKYRQINKFIEFVDDAVEKSGLKKLHIIDFGCGKSYLTFIVYYYLVFVKHLEVEMVGLDLKEDVIEKCNETARKYNYEHLHFQVGNIDGYRSSMPVDMVITLHACDTATDYALFNAICWNAKIIISVPCCQHELCHQMHDSQLPILERYGIIKERSAALMTDAVRGNLLEYCGYKTQLLEFIDFAHTPKNILIRAVKSNISPSHKKQMLQEVAALCQCFGVTPCLWKLLKEQGIIEWEQPQ